MASLAQEIENMRRRMTETATDDMSHIVRLAADVEKQDTALLDEVRSIIEASHNRRVALVQELEKLGRMIGRIPGPPPQSVRLMPHETVIDDPLQLFAPASGNKGAIARR
ncbi:MAG: hypothetical protein B7Y80_17465 [Hyphomicrobium sp. 32-62-53]|jgi:hypothetical protein|nr:MAG: hypothetical protein B7Z29_17340 [Hyphomicrobium sp. 12-62-95]OYX97942.1 MAG: hypothetical protein B7Y80_17465 [Hyphomicrobium sp. 32-62-53]